MEPHGLLVLLETPEPHRPLKPLRHTEIYSLILQLSAGKRYWHGQCTYHTRTIISCGLYNSYPIFHYSLYCRAVYIAERFVLEAKKNFKKSDIIYVHCKYIQGNF